jgi:glycosyltransferase involved in cell wall biosynthesis
VREPSPYFSIIIPMYNRERFIGRALDSCLNQDFANFEVIVIDDGSMDGSGAVVQGYEDPRITLLRHQQNRGVGPARNIGGDAACGEWLIFFDSDDEFLREALKVMAQSCNEVGEEVASLRFMCRLENGTLSPDPPMQDEIWDYEKYIKACEASLGRRNESLRIVRRRTFERVRFPEDRGLEGVYHLDFSRLFLTRTCPGVVRLYHTDADNQLTRPSVSQVLLSAPDLARNTQELLARHGGALRAWAPKVYWEQVSGLVTLHFLSGSRLKGWRSALKCLRRNPASAKVWATLLIGSLGRRPLACLKARRSYLSSKQ